jgi:tRNA threonylcarbamoyl adenosine modification protein YeaZ
MKILAVDTALGACSACVLDGDHIRARSFESMERGHAERLAPMVRETMQAAGLEFAALDRLAVTTGPGTFTGQRVGYAFMRGLRLALRLPLAGITTLEAMAAAALDETGAEAVAVLHDARRGEVYFALVARSGLVVPVGIALFDDALAVLRAALTDSPNVPIFAGTAGARAAEHFVSGPLAAIVSNVQQPDALFVARLAQMVDATAAMPRPLYLRAPDAKLPAGPPK